MFKLQSELCVSFIVNFCYLCKGAFISGSGVMSCPAMVKEHLQVLCVDYGRRNALVGWNDVASK